jgi:UDP-N-acetyl-D-galactosamine dehydrogenase
MFPNYKDFKFKKEKIAVVGLGYVGLPLAVYFGRQYNVIGLDIDHQRIIELKNKQDKTGEINSKELTDVNIDLTFNTERLREARLIIITVPTPIDKYNRPDLDLIKKASKIVGQNLSKWSVVVYESTVYPGLTEEVCVPILGKQSGLSCGVDFKVGYSPERINPGEKEHILPKIVKVVAGQDEETTKLLAAVYGAVIEAGIYIAPNIRTAEAAKVIENIQRDLNIALINELAIIFNKLNIDTKEVLDTASTKWNFLRFEPGLVGGHCIGVDPYYLTYKAEEIGYHSNIILSGRRINNQMGKYIAEQTIKKIIGTGKTVKNSRILILGITFKENIKDFRNTKVVDIYFELKDYGMQPYIHDPLVISKEVKEKYNISLVSDLREFKPYDAIILAVKHKEFSAYDFSFFRTIASENPVFIDVKSMYEKNEAQKAGFVYWRL